MTNNFPHGLFVIRHCRTEYNASHRISGQFDSPIVDFSIDASIFDLFCHQYKEITIISSPLTRCQKTVEYFLNQHAEHVSHVFIDLRIIERGMGSWEGQLKKEILTKHPHYNYRDQFNPLYTPPQGETFNDFLNRIDKFIDDLYVMQSKSPLLICAHNNSLKLLKYRLTNNNNLLDFWISHNFQNGKVERIY